MSRSPSASAGSAAVRTSGTIVTRATPSVAMTIASVMVAARVPMSGA
jgi:hypothetical protein